MDSIQTKENMFQTSVRIPIEDWNKIQKMAKDSFRKDAEQIRFMLNKYIHIVENQ